MVSISLPSRARSLALVPLSFSSSLLLPSSNAGPVQINNTFHMSRSIEFWICKWSKFTNWTEHLNFFASYLRSSSLKVTEIFPFSTGSQYIVNFQHHRPIIKVQIILSWDLGSSWKISKSQPGAVFAIFHSFLPLVYSFLHNSGWGPVAFCFSAGVNCPWCSQLFPNLLRMNWSNRSFLINSS